jgi:hypothetical protein
MSFIELIEGHEAALLGLLDHFLDGSIRQVEQRRRRFGRILFRSVSRLVVFFLFLNLQRLCLAGHSIAPNALQSGCVTAPDPKLFDTHDAKGRRKVFATPKNCFAGFTQWPDAYCGNGVAGCSNRTRVSLFLTGF